MHIQTPEFVRQILTTFHQHDYEIYIVGGAVRDIMLNREVGDWDFTTNATPEQIIELFDETFYDNNFGTVGIVNPLDQQLHEEGQLARIPIYEVTTFRTEHGYSDSRRPDVVKWGTSLLEDLQRRDFTISAIALQPNFNEHQLVDYTLQDPFEGSKHLQQQLVIAVGDPHQRFSEDALRMMRAIRIAAQLGFSIESQTLAAIQAHASTLTNIAAERIRTELLKTISSQFASDAINVMYSTGLLNYIIPELIKARDIEQSGHHTDDVWTHSLLSLKHCPSTDPVVRFATLIHDIGKPYTRAYVCNNCKHYFRHQDDEYPTPEILMCPKCQTQSAYRDVVVFHNHEMAGARLAKEITQRLKFSKKDQERIITLVRWHMFSVDERQTEKAIRRFIRNVGKENLSDILDLRIGDRLGGGARETSWRLERFKDLLIEVQKQPFTVHDIKISGHQIMQILDIKPGRQVGQILNQLFEEVENKQLLNTPSALEERTLQLKQSSNE